MPKPWRERIDEAIARGGCTGEDRAVADQWHTSPSSEYEIPKDEMGRPLDDEIRTCDCYFGNSVERNDMDSASYWLEAIEKRATEVLAEVGQ